VPVTINGSGPIAGASTLNGLTIPSTGFGKMLQVIAATYSTQQSRTAGGYVDTGLTATITPSSISSKILVLVSQNGVAKVSAATSVGIKLVRGSTDMLAMAVASAATGSTATNNIGSVSGYCLDSPATTSATTYKTQFANVSATGTKAINFQHPSASAANITLASDGTVSGGIPSPNRNILYNGAMQVAQRGTSTASITTASYNTADRWYVNISNLGTWTQSVENDAPTGSGFRKSLKMLCTTADASPAAADFASLSISV